MDFTPTLEVLSGLPASGKTTFAKKLLSQGNWVRVNKDDLRAMMDDSVHSKANEGRVIRIRNTIVMDALANGKNVVVDDTNLNPVHIKNLSSIASGLDANFHVTFLDTPLETCMERNEERENPVPQDVILEMYDKYLATKEAEEDEDEELEECIIVDVDGTLAHIDGPNPRNVYDASRAMEDTLDDAVSNIVAMAYQNGYRVVVFTARHSGHLEVTKEWLKENGVNYDEIYCREEGDNRKDTVVKKELYEQHIKGKYKVKYILDDRDCVVNMWRNMGLKCLQVDFGDF